MSFNFPASPSNGQTYEPVNGPVFTWDGTAWKALSQGMPVTVFVADTPPAAPSFGNLWWESDTGNLYIYYNDGDSSQWVQVNGTPAGYQTADTRNRIVNGAMQISQENGTTFGVGTGYYPVDQWRSATGLTGATPDWRQIGVNPQMIRLSSGGTAKPSLAVGDYVLTTQAIEGINIRDFGWGAAGALPVVLRFMAWADAGTGTYCATIRDSGNTATYVMPFTVTATPTVFSFAIPGPTIGNWPTDTSLGAQILFTHAAGTSFHTTPLQWASGNYFGVAGMSNLLATTVNIFRWTNVGLYLDPDNTGVAPKWQMPDEAEELRACQRYWCNVLGYTGGNKYGTAGATLMDAGSFPFMVTMRAPTAVSISGTPAYTNCSALSVSGSEVNAAGRVTVTASGTYRVISWSVIANARM